MAEQFQDSAQTLGRMVQQAEQVQTAAQWMIDAYKKGHKILVFGNGGSAADSQHFADELVGRFERNRPPLSALALTVNSSDLTSIGNDFGYDQVFARQLEAHAKPGDIVVAISTSGNSPNVLAALQTAKRLSLKTVGLSGKTGGQVKTLVDLCICVPSTTVARIQEAHITTIQIICGLIESALFPDAPKAH
ncbi:MAG: hypothetical protein A3G41_06395 [Elusimicrobia bacterium RIFCSPLOWO2_12_FULL_59_9]|nr:MAG: hypothetical protein A3G41_06395 [Elusimicrobia bacterium RIFCSPLOWO2_12_FULL_59_9]